MTGVPLLRHRRPPSAQQQRSPRASLSLTHKVIVIAAVLALAGCGHQPRPLPAPPPITIPPTWALEPPWRDAQPRDAVPKGPWWQRLGDAQLATLVQQALQGSSTLAVADARLAQARALASAASAGLFPSLSLGTRISRQRSSANRPLASYNATNVSTVQNDYVAAFSVNYELDWAGRLQQGVDAAQASAQQAAADLENARLLLTAELTSSYVALRALDTELDVLQRAIALQRRALAFVATRHQLGAANGLELAQQQALLDNTLTQVEPLRRQRAQFEHAIATLTGTPAPLFSLATAPGLPQLPEVPLGLPSELLERRPDVASAERAMAVANAQIGVAKAAFYPSITLSPSIGVDSRNLASLLQMPSLVWSLGTSVATVLLDGGRLQANADAARAGHQLAAANYRRVVLTAMQEVQDGISGLAALTRATQQADAARASARRVLALANGRYEGGIGTNLEVIVAQQALLATERQATQLQGQSLLTGVFLIKALGGDW